MFGSMEEEFGSSTNNNDHLIPSISSTSRIEPFSCFVDPYQNTSEQESSEEATVKSIEVSMDNNNTVNT